VHYVHKMGSESEEALKTLSEKELGEVIARMREKQGCQTEVKSNSQNVFVVASKQQRTELIWVRTEGKLTNEMARKFQQFSKKQGADRATIASTSSGVKGSQQAANHLGIDYLGRERILSAIDSQTLTQQLGTQSSKSQSDQTVDSDEGNQNKGKRIALPLRTRMFAFIFGSVFLLGPTYMGSIVGWIGVMLGLVGLYSAVRGSWSKSTVESLRESAEQNPYMGDTYTVYVWIQKLIGTYSIVVQEASKEGTK